MLIQRVCEVCGTEFVASRKNARYCSPAHRTQGYRARAKAKAAGLEASAKSETPEQAQDDSTYPVTAATLAELVTAHQEASAAGLVALALARRIDRAGLVETGSSFAALVRAHTEALTRATTAGDAPEGDFLDELERKREERRAAGRASP